MPITEPGGRPAGDRAMSAFRIDRIEGNGGGLAPAPIVEPRGKRGVEERQHGRGENTRIDRARLADGDGSDRDAARHLDDREQAVETGKRLRADRHAEDGSEGVVNIFVAAGLEKPDISILSEEFLAEVRGMKQRNLAVELLQKLLKGELATRRRKNVVQARSFAEMLEKTLWRYQNRAVEAAQVIEELIQLARELREANARGEELGLSEDEVAFYDALEANDSAVQVLGDETLRDIARELVQTVRSNVAIDWTLRENVRANLRRLVKRILRKHGYPPDKQEKATQTVLEQAEVLSEGWALED